MTVDDDVELAVVPVAVQIGTEDRAVGVEFGNGEFFPSLTEATNALTIAHVAVADLVGDGHTTSQCDALFIDGLDEVTDGGVSGQVCRGRLGHVAASGVSMLSEAMAPGGLARGYNARLRNDLPMPF